ncbi:MAG: SurA N-terminal domain-containing protein [Anaerolineae bacterium]
MANTDNPNPRPSSRQGRREERFAKQQEQQLRTMRIVGAAIAGVIALIVIVGLIVEYVFVPRQAVAIVNGTEITMADWQEQVRFQRGQIITSINDNFELFNDAEAEDQVDARENTIRTLQQFFGQQIGALVQGHEQIGQSVLENMISIELVRQEAANRGITISQAEVDAELGEQYSFYDGGLPTPFPTPENTPIPTPSITPIPDPALEGTGEEAAPTEAPPVEEAGEELPTSTPQPTNTPVSKASFDEQLQEDLTKLEDLGVNSRLRSNQVEEGLIFQALGKSLYEENGGGPSAPHISAYLLVFATEEEADAALGRVNSDGYLQVWNEIRSLPADPENPRPPQALERIEDTVIDYSRSYEALSEAIAELQAGDMTDVISDIDAQSSFPVFIIAQVTGNEELELSGFAIQQLESDALQEWLTDARATQNVEVFENWRNRVPRQPILDSDFSQPVNTPTPPPVDTGQ